MLIPMFPLSLLPLPGELIPLHIFEPRYKQLLQDAESTDINFGIYCTHELNKEKVGGLMKLESVIKRYNSGESDIVVRCIDIFSMDKLLRNYKSKQYPGGEVELWNVNKDELPDIALYDLFIEYQHKRNIKNHNSLFSLYQIAAELNLDLFDRYSFLNLPVEKKLGFLIKQLKFQLFVINQYDKSKDFFHLN
ncbi:LON peptidase substrate-binding domain-containing protein [Chryseosolibacter indicus]|uniref:LON peptidase substrate-binding domain-containing protein n=1 Tax=Chryseosolibacter indicus TaxID=2782351 RepID=A0ABS5VU53_9BACT|nr:LON peptidase substrate-binding domain-containing protein [Chryseosolibacter indicus]MBT1704953.1 LON peptidase substrate-binding domain-containing protein [Chryseosolibacter indicus]